MLTPTQETGAPFPPPAGAVPPSETRRAGARSGPERGAPHEPTLAELVWTLAERRWTVAR